MGDLRKDYVLDKFVIVPRPSESERIDPPLDGSCPYCPGNESMTEPAQIALVAKDGMLQRLSDSEENIVCDWCVRVFQSNTPAVTTSSSPTTLINHYTANPHTATIKYWLLLQIMTGIYPRFQLTSGQMCCWSFKTG